MGAGSAAYVSPYVKRDELYGVCMCVLFHGGTCRRDSGLKMKTRVKRPAGAKELWGKN